MAGCEVAGRSASDAAVPVTPAEESPSPATLFDDARDFHDGAAAVALRGKDRGAPRWAFIGKEPRWLAPPRWDEVTDWSVDHAWGRVRNRWSLVLERGGVPALPFSVSEVRISGALSAARSGGRWGIVGPRGEVIVRPQFTDAVAFGPDRFWGRDGKWTLVTREGAKVTFDNVEVVRNATLARTTAAGKLCLVGAEGACIVDGEVRLRWEGDFAIVEAGPKRGLVTRAGQLLLPARFEDVKLGKIPPFWAKSGAWALFGVDGKELIEPRFDEVNLFERGAARVKQDGRWGFAFPDGRVIEPSWEDVAEPGDGMAPVRRDGKWGFISLADGKVRIPPQYDRALPFTEERAAVRLDGRWGYIGEKGQVVVPPKYGAVRPFSGGYAAIRSDDGWGVIDRAGQVVLAPGYDELGELDHGAAIARHGGQKVCVSASSAQVVSLRYDDVGPFTGGRAVVRRLGRCGYLDALCREAIPLEHADCQDVTDHTVAIVRAPGGEYVLLGPTGTRLWSSKEPIVGRPDGTFAVPGKRALLLGADGRPLLRDGWRREPVGDKWRFVDAKGVPLNLPRTR